MHDTSSHLDISTPRSQLLLENGQLAAEASAVYIPPDQMRMIQNINTLLSEVVFFSL